MFTCHRARPWSSNYRAGASYPSAVTPITHYHVSPASSPNSSPISQLSNTIRNKCNHTRTMRPVESLSNPGNCHCRNITHSSLNVQATFPARMPTRVYTCVRRCGTRATSGTSIRAVPGPLLPFQLRSNRRNRRVSLSQAHEHPRQATTVAATAAAAGTAVRCCRVHVCSYTRGPTYARSAAYRPRGTRTRTRTVAHEVGVLEVVRERQRVVYAGFVRS